MRLYLTISFIFLSLKLFCQFKYRDTVFIIRDSNSQFYHRVFFDTNRQSEFYSLVSNFEFDKFDKETYKRSFEYLKSKHLTLTKKNYSDFPKRWVTLKKYKDTLYVYSPADYYSHYKVKLTDKGFINWTGEGPELNYVKEFKKINSNTFSFKLVAESSDLRIITIKYLDKPRGISVFQEKRLNKQTNKWEEFYYLMAEVSKMRQIPLIVNYCDNEKRSELDFDEIDLKKIFTNIK